MFKLLVCLLFFCQSTLLVAEDQNKQDKNSLIPLESYVRNNKKIKNLNTALNLDREVNIQPDILFHLRKNGMMLIRLDGKNFVSKRK